jgi:hypothetical protein
MDRPDWSLGAVGLSLVALAAVALLVVGAFVASNWFRTPRIEKRLDEISVTCQQRAERRVAADDREAFVEQCEDASKASFNSVLFPPD